MRLSIRFLLMLVPAVAVVVLGFITILERLERKWVWGDLNSRAQLVSDSVHDSVVNAVTVNRPEVVSRLLERIARKSKLYGLVLCSTEGQMLGQSGGGGISGVCESVQALALQPPAYSEIEGDTLHRAVFAVLDDSEKSQAYLVVLQSPAVYMVRQGMLTRKYAVIAFLVLVLLLSLVTVMVHRWSVSQPIEQASAALKALLKGDVARARKAFENTEFAPFVKDLDRVLVRLRRSKRDEGEVNSNIWTPGRLRNEVQRLFGDSRLCVIANREPYIHNRKGKTIEIQFPASGLVTAVEPIVRACSGLWIGHGSGTADRETADKNGVILVPPNQPEYALKRVWLTKEEEQGYYYGFSNEGIWPLCHIAHTRPLFRVEDWNCYRAANLKFAEAFDAEMKGSAPIALIQDYHFALLPQMIRERRPDAVTSLFWHIPWPNPESIRICPWREELLRGMLGADLIGFHIQYHCNNFLDTIDSFLEARVDRENFSVTIGGHTCYVKPFPISVEWPSKHGVSAEKIPTIRSEVCEEFSIPSDCLIGLGVDRLDYTKGIVERLLAVERLLELHPEFIGRFVFLQIAAPSRTHIKRYQQLDSEVREVATRINHRFRKPGYDPVILKVEHRNPDEVFRYYAASDVCLVTSLHDGMNLVAKEYVTARSDEKGALVLSSFTGAAREMTDAFIVNPYDIEESAKAIYKSLTMTSEEQRGRMSRLRNLVATNNVYAWAGRFLEEVHRISESRKALGPAEANS